MKRYFILGIIFLIASCSSFEGGTLKPMQEDFDKIRLDHIFIIDGLIKEFKQKTGRYPFEENEKQLPVATIIETEYQKKSHEGKVPIFLDLEIREKDGVRLEKPKRIDIRSIQELENEISKGLGRNIVLPKDHQKVPVNKPSVYLYTYYLGEFEITAFLHNDFKFSRPLGPFYNKITLSSSSANYMGIWKSENLKELQEFINFYSGTFNKGGYERRAKL